MKINRKIKRKTGKGLGNRCLGEYTRESETRPKVFVRGVTKRGGHACEHAHGNYRMLEGGRKRRLMKVIAC